MMDDAPLSPIEETPHETTNRLLARVRGMHRRRKRRAWLIPIITLVGVYATSVAGLVWWPLFFCPYLTGLLGLCIWALAERNEMRTIEALADCREIRAVGGLLESVNCSNPHARAAVQASLVDLLPRLTEGDSALLGAHHREILNGLLYCNPCELAIAALSAIEQVGDNTALPSLSAIAEGKGMPNGLLDYWPAIRERAQRAVEAIRERMERQNAASVLLRASENSDSPSEHLVRPAQDSPSRGALDLLRPEGSVDSPPGEQDNDSD